MLSHLPTSSNLHLDPSQKGLSLSLVSTEVCNVVVQRMERLMGSIVNEVLTMLEEVMSHGNTVLRRMPSSDVADLKGIELLASGTS